MAKIPFDIKFRPQIESGEYKVETRDGKRARIICWDRRYNDQHKAGDIIGLVDDGYGEAAYYFNLDGTHWNENVDKNGRSNFDLFLVTPEPELTSWQTFISGCLQKYGLLDCGAADRIAKECSTELLELAKEELTKQGNLILPIEAFEKRYVKAQEKGRKEALKDLPRWRKEQGEMELAGYGIIGGGVASQENPRVYLNGHSIDLYSLEKLPGFNE